MNLTSPSQVKAWCIENGFHPNKVLGQNFLIDRNALVSIVDAGLAGCSGAHDAEVLEATVVVGYGTLKKTQLVGAVETVDGEALENRTNATVSRSLQGQVAGEGFDVVETLCHMDSYDALLMPRKLLYK